MFMPFMFTLGRAMRYYVCKITLLKDEELKREGFRPSACTYALKGKRQSRQGAWCKSEGCRGRLQDS